MESGIKSLAEIKKYLEKRLEELQREEKLLREILKLVDSALSSQSFVKASELPKQLAEEAREDAQKSEALEKTAEEEPSQIFTVSSRFGEQLARIFVYPKMLVIKFSRTFHTSTQPFQAFFVRKVLEGFKRKDEDLIVQGLKTPDEKFDYKIVEEDGVLKEIVIYNYGSKDNVVEIKNTLRWTLNKMLQREGTL